MKKSLLAVILGTSMLVSGFITYVQSSRAAQASQSQRGQNTQKSKSFFQSFPQPTVRVQLTSDPFVMKSLQGYTPPNIQVSVNFPVYPGAEKTQAVSGIGDLGTPMTPNLVDGSAYFISHGSESSIEAWYTNEFKKLGYVQCGSGSSTGPNSADSTYVQFSPKGQSGNPTVKPNLDLGFMSHGNEILFKLRATYIVVPPRPSDSYLPTDIVKATVSMGNQTRVVTNPHWIERVVSQINHLQTSIGGMTSCPNIIGPVSAIHVKFERRDGTKTSVTFGIPCGVRNVTVGSSKAALAGSSALDKEVEGLFPSTSGGNQ